MSDESCWDGIRNALAGAVRVAVIGIGDECSPVDRLGMETARSLRDAGLPREGVFLAGTVPESITAPVRRYRPDHILLLDAADMGVRPGTLAVVSPETIRGTLVSTHSLPLSAVMEYLAADTSAPVTLIGIQPDLTRPETGLKQADQEFLDRNTGRLLVVLQEPGSAAGRGTLGER